MGKPYNEILKELRTDKDMTQAEVAKILKTEQSYYSKYEAGKHPSLLNTYARYAYYTKYPPTTY